MVSSSLWPATLAAEKAAEPRGAFVSGKLGDLPILVENERSLLRVQLNAGFGTYADHNPWFGSAPTYTSASPIATDPPGPGWATWAEAWVEYGLAGATRLGESNAYAFGEATMLRAARAATWNAEC